MSPFERVLKEAHRRGLWQVLVVFAGGGWGVLGVLDTLIGYGYLPEWVFGGGLLALLAGLPVVSATAWIQGARRVRPPATGGDPADEALLAAAEAGTPAHASSAGSANGVDEGSANGVDEGFDPVDFFTWPRAITGGVVAFALLGVLSSGYMFMRATGIGAPGTLMAQGVLENGSLMVLADFESTAGETAPGDLLTESLRIDLAQSDALTLVSEADVQASLGRMRLDPADPITEAVAIEIAEREGAPAVIAGEVGRVGSGFIINARVIGTESGAPLAQFRVTAAGEDELIGAIDELARSMRDKIGESLRSIAATESLEAVTTGSIEALRKFTAASQGLDRGTLSATIAQQLFEEATALDSTFSSAHRALAIAIFNYGGDRELMNTSSAAAFRHRGRLPDHERLATEAFYHRFSGDRSEAARAYRAILALDPTNIGATANLTDILIYDGAYEEAIEASRAIAAWDISAWAFNYMVALAATGDFEAASAANDTFAATVPDDPYDTWRDVMLRTTSGRPAEAVRIASSAPPISDPLANAYTQYAIGSANVGIGRVGTARELHAAALAQLETYSGPENAFRLALSRPWLTLYVTGDTARARAELDDAMRDHGWEELSPFNRDYPGVAMIQALTGWVEGASALLDSFDAEVAPGADPQTLGIAATARALVAVRQGEAGALTRFDDVLPDVACARCADFMRGLVHESYGDPAVAIASYEAYLAKPFFDGGTFMLNLFPSVVHERLALLHDAQGDPVSAAEHYLRFAELWADADPEFQSRVEGARDRAAELTGMP